MKLFFILNAFIVLTSFSKEITLKKGAKSLFVEVKTLDSSTGCNNFEMRIDYQYNDDGTEITITRDNDSKMTLAHIYSVVSINATNEALRVVKRINQPSEDDTTCGSVIYGVGRVFIPLPYFSKPGDKINIKVKKYNSWEFEIEKVTQWALIN